MMSLKLGDCYFVMALAAPDVLDSSYWRMSAGIDSRRWRAGLVKVGSDSIATDHSSNNSECVPARTKMMVLPSRR